MSHTLRMLLGCTLPLLLIFLLPLFGLGQGVALFVALLLMFACHLLMMGDHHRGHAHDGLDDEMHGCCAMGSHHRGHPNEGSRQTDQGDRHAHA